MTIPRPSRRVAVIGAGLAGAIAVDALIKEQAFSEIRVFDRQDQIGGTWVWKPKKRQGLSPVDALLDQSATAPASLPPALPRHRETGGPIDPRDLRHSEPASHANLHSNLPPEIMAFSQEPIPEIITEETRSKYGDGAPFRHRSVIRDWVEDIFKRNGQQQLVELDTAVERAQRSDSGWTLTLRKAPAGTSTESWWQETFDSVVVATGHYHVPSVPNIPGLAAYDDNFPGRIRHTKHFQTANEFSGKRVLVVGGSVSAFDALHDIRRVSKLPVLSSLRRVSPTFGWSAFTHPHIDNRGAISALDPDSGRIHFSDGSFADDIDIVLLATGYDFSFPFLSGIVTPANGRIPGLYQHIFKIDDPTLAFVGMVTGGFGLRIFEWQAVAAARVLASHATLPSRETMAQWERDRVLERGDGVAFWGLMPDFERYFEDLRGVAGDPAPGTAGRVLPKYDPAWADVFWRFVQQRIDWWERDARGAREGAE